MSRGINKVTLVGYLGSDPKVGKLPSGEPAARISLATSESWKDRETWAEQTRTEWHHIVFYGRLAELAAQYLKKGQQVYIEGALRTRSWQSFEGGMQTRTEVIAREMQFLGGKSVEKAVPCDPDKFEEEVKGAETKKLKKAS